MGHERHIDGSIMMTKKIMHIFFTIRDMCAKHSVVFFSLVMTVLCALMMVLVYEYRCFKRETEKMIGYKEDYRNYVIAVKKILSDYNKTKARLEELETLVVEKKNEFDDLDSVASNTVFPEGVRVYSSDDEGDDDGSSFLIINRDLEYLKQSTLDYLKEQKLSYLQNRMSADMWLDYTDQILERHKEQAQKKNLSRRKRVSTRKQKKSYEQQTQQASESKIRKRVYDVVMSWPIDRSNFWISSPFGPRRKPNGTRGFHAGIDMASVKGTPVKAAASGIVVEARYASGYGNNVIIAHSGKYRTRYAHLSSFSVDVGQKVERGEQIGKVGATGFVRSKRRGGDASHLHFEVSAFGKPVNPMYFLG